jgi:hypothetical protein
MDMFTEKEIEMLYQDAKFESFATGTDDGTHWYNGAPFVAFIERADWTIAIAFASELFFMEEFTRKMQSREWEIVGAL